MYSADTDSTVIVLVVIYLFDVIYAIQMSALFPFFTKVSDKKMGGTAINIYASFLNLARKMPRTVGLKLADILPYEIYGGVTLIMMLVMMVPLYFMARYLDQLDPRL